MYWPSSSDPYYSYNQTENTARKTYYNITYTPCTKCDGVLTCTSNFMLSYNQRSVIPSPVAIEASGSAGADIAVSASVTADSAFTGRNLAIRFALVQLEYDSTAPGYTYTHFEYTFLDFAPNPAGIAFDIDPSQTQNFNTTFPFPTFPGCDLGNLAIVVMVQKESTKEILQAEIVYFSLPVTVSLSPVSPPVQIPANGGTFDYNIGVTNGNTGPSTFDIWVDAGMPGGTTFGPIFNVNFTIPQGQTITRVKTQSVPAAAPSGVYSYNAYVGHCPSDIWDSESFSFEKLAVSDGGLAVTGWDCYDADNSGGDLPAEILTPSNFAVLSSYPNPFNPETTLNFTLQEAGYIQLRVYDTGGRLITELTDGMRNAGSHSVVFNASEFASGVYFAVLNVEGRNYTQKMLLLK